MGWASITLEVAGWSVMGSLVNTIAGQIPAATRDGGGILRRALAVIVATPTLAIPFVHAHAFPPPVLFAMAGFLMIQWFRVLEIVRAPHVFDRRWRLLRVATAYESRLMKRAPRAFPIATFTTSALGLAVLLVVLVERTWIRGPTTPYALEGWPRWLLGGALGYVGLEIATIHVRSALRPWGWEHAKVQNAPILSRTVGELWGSRWNQIISVGLRKNVFEPLARRKHATLGLFASFVVSAILHMFMTLPAAGLTAMVWMGAFFLVHGVIAVVESKIGVRRWPPIAGHAWALGAFAITLPLFSEPFLRSLGL